MNFIKYFIVCLFFAVGKEGLAQKRNLKTDTIIVYGACEQCKSRIENALSKYGTYTANWDIETKILIVRYDSVKLSRLKIEQKLASVGHDTKSFQSDERTYLKLPACCHYERYEKPGMRKEETPIKMEEEKEKNKPIKGFIFEADGKGKQTPVYGALVRVINTNNAVYADSIGFFQLFSVIPATLVVSYLGYPADTITVSTYHSVKIVLQKSSSITLSEVEVDANVQSSYVSSLNTLNTLNIGSEELTKAACCNLSESFETSPSVDVSYSDAVTGIKQIQLLGLSGIYTQITTENIPEIKGLPGSYGLTFIPGPWIDAIQVTKGTGSVANGYESIAGQINIEEKKPDKMDRIFLNSYANNMGRLETSINLSKQINHYWSTALLTNVNGMILKSDENKDGFLDNPLGRHYNFLNRWKYVNDKGVIAQFSIKALSDKREAGEVGFDPLKDKLTRNKYGVGINLEQYAFSGKLGYVFPEKPFKSIGIIFSANSYTNNAYYGLNKYDADQKSIYANLIFQSKIITTIHKYRTGLSFVKEDYNETFDSLNFKRQEMVPGAFFEYTYTPVINFTAIIGLRLDYHSFYGFKTTPRLHLKYDISPTTNVRFSAGSGFRVANVFAENIGVFVSSRQYHILTPTSTFGYGLNPEKAWNYGFNLIHQFKINSQAGSISIDAYQTKFSSQVVVDVDANPQQVLFYNLHGNSFSNSIQAEVNYELIRNLNMRLAYRWLDVQTNYSGVVLDKPLMAKHRAFINFGYEAKSHWKFDFTMQWIGRKRLPNSSSNPVEYQVQNYSPSYMQMNGQVSKIFNHKWDVYLGVENMTNYTQNNLIISASQPFSPYFDGSMIWGPVNGRTIYIGLRFKTD